MKYILIPILKLIYVVILMIIMLLLSPIVLLWSLSFTTVGGMLYAYTHYEWCYWPVDDSDKEYKSIFHWMITI